MKKAEANDFLNIVIPTCITYVQEYPYIGLMMISLSEVCIPTIFDPLLSSMNIDITEPIDFEVIRLIGQVIIDRSVYKDLEVADELVYEAFPPKFPIDDEKLYYLYQAYSCVRKDIEDTEAWLFFKSYILIHASDWSADYKEAIIHLYSLDRNLTNLDYKLMGNELKDILSNSPYA